MPPTQEFIQVTVQPSQGAFVKSKQITVQMEINGKNYGVRKTVPETFFVAQFDRILAEVARAVRHAVDTGEPLPEAGTEKASPF